MIKIIINGCGTVAAEIDSVNVKSPELMEKHIQEAVELREFTTALVNNKNEEIQGILEANQNTIEELKEIALKLDPHSLDHMLF